MTCVEVTRDQSPDSSLETSRPDWSPDQNVGLGLGLQGLVAFNATGLV